MIKLAPDAIQLVDYKQDGEQTRHYRFRLADNRVIARWQLAQPGQFFMLNLPDAGEAAFTFTRLPAGNGEFSALIRNVGQVTSAIFSKKPGDILGARGPYGKGWPMNGLIGKRVLVIGGGCGLAPLASLIDRQIRDKTHEKIAVIYGARNSASQVLAAERERWKEAINLYQVIEDAAGSSCQMGGTPLNALPVALEEMEGAPEIALLCGPEPMMVAIARHLTGMGIPAGSIYFSMERRMHCGIGLCGHCYIRDKYACTDGPTFRWDELLAAGVG